jgi:hypothetical protein
MVIWHMEGLGLGSGFRRHTKILMRDLKVIAMVTRVVMVCYVLSYLVT